MNVYIELWHTSLWCLRSKISQFRLVVSRYVSRPDKPTFVVIVVGCHCWLTSLCLTLLKIYSSINWSKITLVVCKYVSSTLLINITGGFSHNYILLKEFVVCTFLLVHLHTLLATWLFFYRLLVERTKKAEPAYLNLVRFTESRVPQSPIQLLVFWF